MRLRILLITESSERALLIEQALAGARHQVAAAIRPDDDLVFYVQQAQPDALIAELNAPSPDFLEKLRQLDEQRPRPVVIFTAHSGSPAIRTAIKAGVSAYVVDGFGPTRVMPVLEAAFARFAEFQALRSQRDNAVTKLAERKTVERAKGILMQRRKLSEGAAHATLRKMAMDHGKRVEEMARSIILAEETLAQV